MNMIHKSNSESKIQNLICFDDPSEKLNELAQKSSIKVFYYHTLLHDFIKDNSLSYISEFPGNRDHIFTLSYTSGTENNPKGVMLTNRNFLSAITNIMIAGL